MLDNWWRCCVWDVCGRGWRERGSIAANVCVWRMWCDQVLVVETGVDVGVVVDQKFGGRHGLK